MRDPEYIRIPRPEPPIRIPPARNGRVTSYQEQDDIPNDNEQELIRIPRPHNLGGQQSNELHENQSTQFVKDRRGLVIGLVIPFVIVLGIVIFILTQTWVYSILPPLGAAIALPIYWNKATKVLERNQKTPPFPVDIMESFSRNEIVQGTIIDHGTNYAICPYCFSEEEDRKIFAFSPQVKCRICGTAHHPECWEANGGCGSLARH